MASSGLETLVCEEIEKREKEMVGGLSLSIASDRRENRILPV